MRDGDAKPTDLYQERRPGYRGRHREAHRQFILADEAGARSGSRGSEGAVKMRILIAVEDERRVYREALGSAIEEWRPRLEVAVCRFGEFEGQLQRLEPQVVICGRFRMEEPGDDTLAWVELSLDPLDPNQPTKIRMGQSRWDIHNPSLKDLLWVIDEAEQLALSGVPTQKN